MRCERVSELACELVDGALDAVLAAEVELHLRDCQACAGEVAAAREMVAVLSRLPAIEAPPELVSEISRALDRDAASRGQRRFRWHVGSIAAALALATGLAGWLSTSSSPSPAGPADRVASARRTGPGAPDVAPRRASVPAPREAAVAEAGARRGAAAPERRLAARTGPQGASAGTPGPATPFPGPNAGSREGSAQRSTVAAPRDANAPRPTTGPLEDQKRDEGRERLAGPPRPDAPLTGPAQVVVAVAEARHAGFQVVGDSAPTSAADAGSGTSGSLDREAVAALREGAGAIRAAGGASVEAAPPVEDASTSNESANVVVRVALAEGGVASALVNRIVRARGGVETRSLQENDTGDARAYLIPAGQIAPLLDDLEATAELSLALPPREVLLPPSVKRDAPVVLTVVFYTPER